MIELATVYTLASEKAESVFSLSVILELGVIVSTMLLVIVSAGLWYSTAQVHKDEINKMTGALAHDNDNMKDVAIAEIHAHHNPAQLNRMKQIKSRKH